MTLTALALATAGAAHGGAGAAAGAGLSSAAQAGAELALNATGGSSAVKIFILVTALSFASALILSLTSFTRIIIVLSFLRQALGTPQLPPNPVLMGLALFLTLFIMAPTATRVHTEALRPYLDDEITATEAISRGEGPLREWDVEADARGGCSPLLRDLRRGPSGAWPAGADGGHDPGLHGERARHLLSHGALRVHPHVAGRYPGRLGAHVARHDDGPAADGGAPLKIGVFLLAGGWHLVVSSLVRSF